MPEPRLSGMLYRIAMVEPRLLNGGATRSGAVYAGLMSGEGS